MLARLLRILLLAQLLTGALLGAWAVTALTPYRGATAGALILLASVGWVLLWQVLVIAVTMLQSRAQGPMGPWLRAAWGELKAALLIFGLRMPFAGANPGLLPPLGQPLPGQTKLPVLLVHGYICNHRVWDKVSAALRQAGHPVLALDLEPIFASIDDYAVQIERAVIELASHTGSPRVVLVGHSMGGLAIRAWLRLHGTKRVAGIITLGTPHQGTRIAKWVTTPNGAQMAHRSGWIAAMEQGESASQRQLMHLALTHHDNVVFPQREQRLDAARVTEFSGIGHLELCLNDAVLDWLLREIDAVR